jgi:small-conductance mechanosensitive channel
MTGDMSQLTTWLSTNGLPLAIGIVVIYLAYRWAQPAIHRLLVRITAAQSAHADGDPALRGETDKRVATIEDLLHRLLRVAMGVAVVVLFMGVFDLWPLLAGLGLIVAGVTLAGQSIVLDYLMGLLILIEAQYFKGDIIRVGMVEGTVLEVGFRRTVIRDNRGVIHSISNGMIREAANLTRTYAVATIEIDGVADHDVEAVIEALDGVGRSIAEDPAWAERLLETPAYAGTTRLSATGATVRLRGRVDPESRTLVEQELRRRAAAALSAKGIELIRPGTVPPA